MHVRLATPIQYELVDAPPTVSLPASLVSPPLLAGAGGARRRCRLKNVFDIAHDGVGGVCVVSISFHFPSPKSCYSGEDDWFSYTNEFNREADSPGAAGNYNFEEAGNIDNIPLNDEAPLSPGQAEFDLAGPIEDYQYDPLGLSPNGGLNGHHQQPGPSGSNDVNGQFQNMHVMQNTDTFDQHMQPSTSIEYNSFEMPTVVNSNHETGPYQDLGIDDPNSYYIGQQPSTSQGNDMIINENYDMMGQPTTYIPQIDHMNPSSVGNPSSHSGMNQQQDVSGVQVQQQQPSKPKPKKKPAKKKATPSAPDSVGNVLAHGNKIVSSINDNREQKVEARLAEEDSHRAGELFNELTRLQAESGQGIDHSAELIRVQAQIAQLFSKSFNQDSGENSIVSQIQIMSGDGASTSSSQPVQQLKKAAPKRNRNNQNQKNTQQQQQPPQPQPPLPQAQMTPAKIVMEPPTTTLVPSISQANNIYHNGGNENYAPYQQMDDPGTSQQQHYREYNQPESLEPMQQHHQNQGQEQIIQTKVVPTMNQRTHSYRQPVIFTQNTNGPGPSPHIHQPQSHESHHMDQMQDQQFHPQDHQGPQSQQMYAPVHQQQDGHVYQPQEMEPTLGDVVRQTQGRYQGPQDAPNLRQQLITNVNATTSKQMLQRSQAPTPSPGNFHNSSIHQQQYGEPLQHHGSYPHSHDMQPRSQVQQGYDNQYDGVEEFFDMPIQNQEPQMNQMHSDLQHQQPQYDQQEMYTPMDDQEQQIMEPEIDYPPMPQVTIELTEEELETRLEEKRQIREKRVKQVMLDQLNRLEAPVDMTPFRGKIDVLERMLPYHHFTNGEEPVSNFDSTFQKAMSNAVCHANALGNRIRNIVLRDTMRTSTEWEENMLLFLETESERRKLEEDRQLAEQDPHAFLQNSDVIESVRNNRLNLEHTRQAMPTVPEHLKELDLQSGQLSSLYKEYEFDSYDENRPRGSPIPFVYEDLESESEPEPEPEIERDQEQNEEPEPTRGDLSPLVGFPQLSPVPSPARYRNESESTIDWKDEDESPLLSPETVKLNKAAEQFRRDIFGTQEDLDKPEPFPFEQISEATRRHQQEQQQQPPRASESICSSVESSSTAGSTPQQIQHPKMKSPSPKPSISSSSVQIDQNSRSPTPISHKSPETAAESVSIENNGPNSEEGSPEIGDDYSMSPPEKPVSIPADQMLHIPFPVHLNNIKNEKEDAKPKLKLRVPVEIFKMVAIKDDDDVQQVPAVKREPLKLTFKLTEIKKEEPSPDRDVSRQHSKSRTVTPSATPSRSVIDNTVSSSVIKSVVKPSSVKTPLKTKNTMKESVAETPLKSPVFKTPLQTPLKNTESRKRRSNKIENSPQQRKRIKEIPSTSSFSTPKNGLIEEKGSHEERFTSTMSEGPKIVMKISKIPRNINHFVTPRRDNKGNLHKDLSPTEKTRLTMRLFKKDGNLAVEFIEKNPEKLIETDKKENSSELPISNGPSSSGSNVSTPTSVSSLATKSRPALASRKSSIETAGKDKKNHVRGNKTAYCNRFNPFANVPTSSKPSTSSIPAPPASNSASMKFYTPANSNPLLSQTASLPTALSTPLKVLPIASQPATASSANLIRATPKITVTEVAAVSAPPLKTKHSVEGKTKLSSMLPWMSDTDDSPEQKHKLNKPQPVSAAPSISPSTSRDFLKVKIEPPEAVVATAQQESPRASSSLSMSFFEDDKANGFPFLRSPKRTNEPLPVVEFSDDEEDDLAHSTFSHATDHLLGNSKVNNSVNGVPPVLPWSTDP